MGFSIDGVRRELTFIRADNPREPAPDPSTPMTTLGKSDAGMLNDATVTLNNRHCHAELDSVSLARCCNDNSWQV